MAYQVAGLVPDQVADLLPDRMADLVATLTTGMAV